MTAVLKADMEDGRPAVQSFSERLAVAETRECARPVPVPEDPEITALKLENARLKEELRESRAELSEAVRTARENGQAQALAEFRRDEAAALKLLTEQLRDVFVTIRKRIENWEAVSLAIAQTALARIVCAPERYEELLKGLIRLQIEEVHRESLLQVRVSPADFPDASALEILEAELESDNLKIVRDDAVERGGCVLALRIGEVDSSLDMKWKGLVALFASLAETGCK